MVAKVSRTIVCQLGGLGDVVLTSRIVASLKNAQPAQPVELICRDEFLAVTDLYPVRPDRSTGLGLNPYVWSAPDADLQAVLRRTLQSLDAKGVNCFLSAEYQPTWFTHFLGSWFSSERVIAATHGNRSFSLSRALARKFQIETRPLEGPVTEANLPEAERQRVLLQAVGAEYVRPKWNVPAVALEAAEKQLATWGWQKQGYVICFPLGAPAIPFKRWPQECFAEVLRELVRREGIEVLLTGTKSEEADLRKLAAEVGTDAARVFAGGPEELALLAALTSLARAYLGNDTGTMHLAAEYEIPGVAIFGGGHWPVYTPSASGSTALVHPLPCFHCDWDCAFGHGICVESIPASFVLESITAAIHSPNAEFTIREAAELDASELSLIRSASARYREAARERDRRLEWIIELQDSLRQRESESRRLQKAADERLHELRGKDEALQQVRGEADRVRITAQNLTDIVDARDQLIEDLERLAAERLAALQAESEERKHISVEAERRAEGMREMVKTIERQQEQIGLLSRECDMRLAGMQAASAEAELIRVEAGRREERVIEQLSAECEARLAALRDAHREAEGARREAELRSEEMIRMAAVINSQQERIMMLSQECDLRLQALQRVTAEHEMLRTAEAERSALAERNTQELRNANEQRLAHLEAATANMELIRVEAERRAAEMERMASALQAQQQEISMLAAAAQERLDRLEEVDRMARSLREEKTRAEATISELRERLAVASGGPERERAASRPRS